MRLECYKRVNEKKAPPEMKEESDTTVGNSPALRDGDLLVVESLAILTYVYGRVPMDRTPAWAGPSIINAQKTRTERSILNRGLCVDLCRYLAEKYDQSGRLLPGLDRMHDRVDTLAWVGFAEGALIVHALSITYAAWFIPDEHEKGPARIFRIALNPTSSTTSTASKPNSGRNLSASGRRLAKVLFLIRQELTIADIQVAFPVEYIFTHPTICKGLKDEIRGYTQIKAWLRGLEARFAYKEATRVADYVFVLPNDL